MLRSRKSRREEPLDGDCRQPAVERRAASIRSSEAELADSVGLALLVVLETLAPAERVAFVLHDMFDVPFDEIAPIVGRIAGRRRGSSPAGRAAACRAANAVPEADRRHASARSSTPSWRPRAAATSRRCSPCSIPTSCCARTRPPCSWAASAEMRGAEAVFANFKGKAQLARPRWSMGARASSWRRRAGCCWCSTGRSPATGSSRSTWLPTPGRLAAFELGVFDA